MQSSRSAAFLVLAIIVSFGTAWQLASAQAEKVKPEQKWEYAISGEHALDKMAEAGWELGWVTQSAGGPKHEPHMVFTWKRPKQ